MKQFIEHSHVGYNPSVDEYDFTLMMKDGLRIDVNLTEDDTKLLTKLFESTLLTQLDIKDDKVESLDFTLDCILKACEESEELRSVVKKRLSVV